MMKKMIAAGMAMLVVSSYGGTFELEDLFSITLPDGWVKVPDQVMVSYNEEALEKSEDETAVIYDYGFQLADADGWLKYPCVLIRVEYDGRYSSGDLERYAEQADTDTVKVDEGNTFFMEVHEKSGIKALAARQLTEYGFIEMQGLATVDSFSEFEGVYREAFSNLQLDSQIQYQPRITDNAPVLGNINLGKVLLVSLQAALIGAGLWLVYSLLKRAVKRSKPSRA